MEPNKEPVNATFIREFNEDEWAKRVATNEGDVVLDTLRKLEEEEPILQDEEDIGAKDLKEKVSEGKLN